MKFTGTKSSQSIVSGDMTASDMTISVDKLNIAAFYLRDAIYKDKPLAVVREYLCNALDEHESHNVKKPVEVWFSSDDGLYFLNIRDFAKGLDDHGIRYVFGALLESTKNDDNSNMGGFGIGSKAGHAYADFFEVVSYFEGTASYYNCILEKDDQYPVPIGKIRNLSTEATEESGILIRVPIEGKDLHRFKTLVSVFVSNCKYNSENPVIVYKADNGDEFPEEQTEYKYNGFSIIIKNKDEKISSSLSYRKNKIRMGHATYPFPDGHSIGGDLNLYCEVIIDVPIESLSVPLSRETIKSTDNNINTLKRIYSAIKARRDELQSTINIPFDDVSGSTANSWYIDTFKWSYTDLVDSISGFRTFDNKSTSIKNRYLIKIPNNKYKDKWRETLREFARLDVDSKYMFTYVDPSTIETASYSIITGDYKLLQIKHIRKELKDRGVIKAGHSVKEKVKPEDRPYKVYISSYTTDILSASQFLEKYKPKNGFQSVSDINDITTLSSNCIFLRTSSRRYARNLDYVKATASVTMYQLLLGYGFKDANSEEVVNRATEIKKLERESESIKSAISDYTTGFYLYNPSQYTIDILNGVDVESKTIEQKTRLSKRINSIKSKIINGKFELNPFGSKILSSYRKNRYYRADERLNRNELRALLKMK